LKKQPDTESSCSEQCDNEKTQAEHNLEKVFIKGEEKLEHEMNIFTILQTLAKLKAGLSILMEN
jgi:hypothetical protein